MFAKIFSSIYDGSLGTRGPWEALVTFQQLLVLADRFGDVDITAEVISRRTLIPIDIITKGLDHLGKPDPESRDPNEDGRRIVPISPTRNWGWHIVNYTKYSQIRTAEERREYKAAYYRANRNKFEGNGKDRSATDSSPVVESIPCTQDQTFDVRQALVDEYAKAYPAVDVAATLKEIRAWAISNPSKRKTIKGASRFINSWLAREQNKPQ